MRQEAAFALGEIGDLARSMLPALENAQRDRAEVVRQAAQEAIEKINDDGEDDEPEPAAPVNRNVTPPVRSGR